MHSRVRLLASDFRVRSAAASDVGCPGVLERNWRPDDRVAFVATDAEAGIRGCGGAALLLAHWFYRRPEAQASDYFDYPQHYAIIGESGSWTRHLGPDEQRPWGAAWGKLDVWPSTHHLVADATPEALLLAVLTVEPQWLFWPASLAAPAGALDVAGGGDDRVVRSILKARLRGVILYGPTAGRSAPGWSLELSGGAAELTAASLAALPGPGSGSAGEDRAGCFREVAVSGFLGLS